MVNSIRFNQLTRLGDMRTPRVVGTDSFLSADGNTSSLENTAYAAETDAYTVIMNKVIPDDFSTALEHTSQLKHSGDYVARNGMR
jgi:hypothetical protein